MVKVDTDAAVWQDDAAAGKVISQVLEQFGPEIVLFTADVRAEPLHLGWLQRSEPG